MTGQNEKQQLIVKLYDSAIQCLDHAARSLRAGDPEAASGNIDKARDIIAELDHAVDTSSGTEVTENLHKLYQFLTDRLALADEKQDEQMVGEIIGLLDELNQSWKAITC